MRLRTASRSRSAYSKQRCLMLQLARYFIDLASLKNLINTSATAVCRRENTSVTFSSDGVCSTEPSEIVFGKLSSNMPHLYSYSQVKLSRLISLSFNGLKILKSSQSSVNLIRDCYGCLKIMVSSRFHLSRSSIDLFYFFIFSIFGRQSVNLLVLATYSGTSYSQKTREHFVKVKIDMHRHSRI